MLTKCDEPFPILLSEFALTSSLPSSFLPLVSASLLAAARSFCSSTSAFLSSRSRALNRKRGDSSAGFLDDLAPLASQFLLFEQQIEASSSSCPCATRRALLSSFEVFLPFSFPAEPFDAQACVAEMGLLVQMASLLGTQGFPRVKMFFVHDCLLPISQTVYLEVVSNKLEVFYLLRLEQVTILSKQVSL